MRRTFYTYRLPLRSPLRLKRVTMTHREGLLVRLEDADGRVGWGDVAPLPGFSRETLKEAMDELRSLPADEWGIEPSGGGGAISLTSPIHSLSPSVSAGLELAVLGLEALRKGVRLPSLLATDFSPEVRVNALLTIPDGVDGPDGGTARWLEQADRLVADGYRTIKVKVGGRAVEDDARQVRRLAEHLGDGIQFRLDPNRSWVLDEAVAFARAIEGLPIEYVEEPLADPTDLPELARTTGLRLALDESLLEASGVRLLEEPGVKAVVLKPTLLGGFEAARLWAERASSNGIAAVVSGSFESGVGLRGLVALAAVVSGIRACGLDTYRWLAADAVIPPLPLPVPVLSVSGVLDTEIRPDDRYCHVSHA